MSTAHWTAQLQVLNSQPERWRGIAMAIAFHAILFFVGGLGLIQKADFGMDAASGAIDIDWIAAPAPAASMSADAVEAPAAPLIPATVPADAVAEEVQKPQAALPPAAEAPEQAILRASSGPFGDGSSAVPGKDATTLQQSGSGGAYAKPGYYRNPPPPYPALAREQKQEGLVLLEAHVTKEGRCSDIQLKTTSGFPLLDEAALKAVQSWRFRPARTAGIATDSTVMIPIRFKLETAL
jgi:periplasmic protein TonB